MTKWEDLKTAPDGKPILVRINNGVFSGGWTWHKAVRLGNKFFYAESRREIHKPHSWSRVTV